MYLKRLELQGFKSFAQKRELLFTAPVTAIVGPNGSGKSNIAEAFRFVLGEQSMKSMRTKRGEDLIFNGSRMAGRMNRAMVTVTFDNTERIFPVDYEDVSLSREVMRDGTNRYLINGTQVRLKDVLELLAAAKIGSSQHHIISQGNADRILSANPDERRQMIEDALGLRIYQFKITESSRKLKKTEENIESVASLQREIAPHLKFLEKQVKRIEEARELREELLGEAQKYFAHESRYLETTRKTAESRKKEEQEKLGQKDEEIAKLRSTLEEEEGGEDHEKILSYEKNVSEIQRQKEENTRELGRLEGMISLEEKQIEINCKKQAEGGVPSNISFERVQEFSNNLKNKIDTLKDLENAEEIKTGLLDMRGDVESFVDGGRENKEKIEIDTSELERLQEKQKNLEASSKELEQKEQAQKSAGEDLRAQIEKDRGRFRDAERELFEKMSERSELSVRFSEVERELKDVEQAKDVYEQDLSDFSFLLGRKMLDFEDVEVPDDVSSDEARETQRQARRVLERKRVKVEEMGGSGEEVIEEYENLKERKEFLEKEVKDLQESKASLEELIEKLEKQLDDDFKNGLADINRQFQEFFGTMFGGGKVALGLEKKKAKKKTDEENSGALSEETEEGANNDKRGLEISVSLPQKRVKGVEMLSGGERSLTSIALLFAVSQVNPPPFLVLDETDAALDEANSKRYGQMLENLSKKTQLIIITHNRETMSRADILYGVTVGKDAVSKVLSVKFEDAEKSAAR